MIVLALICIFLLTTMIYQIYNRLSKEYTKKQIIEYIKEDLLMKCSWFVYVITAILVIFCPLLNIVIIVILGFNQGNIYNYFNKELCKKYDYEKYRNKYKNYYYKW